MASTDRIEPLLAHWEPRIARAFLEAVKTMRDDTRLTELVPLLQRGDIDGAFRVIGLDAASFRPLDLAVTQAYEAGGVDATLGIAPVQGPLGYRITPRFDMRQPSAEGWVRGHTIDLIKQITDDQREMIRDAMRPLFSGADPMMTGETPQKIALDLVGRISRVTGRREGGLIGLTAEQARWARNYEAELTDPDTYAAALKRKLRDRRFDRTIAKAMREGRLLSDDQRDNMVRAYRARALRYRGETIALNEASTALHASQTEAWDQAVRKGVIAENMVRRFWLTAEDDRVRPTHAAVPGMNREGVGLHAPFATPKGPTMLPGWQFDPGCRCRVRVRVVEPVQ